MERYFKNIEPIKLLKKSFLRKNMDFYQDMNPAFLDSMKLETDVFTYKFGASKLVLIPIDSSEKYVIKIPYTGYYRSSHYYEKTLKSGSYIYCPHEYDHYEYGEIAETPWDYCAGEVKRYRKALKNGFAHHFARTFFYTRINGYPVYLQERCEVLSENRKKYNTYSKQEINKTSLMDLPINIYNMNWLTSFRIQYGEQELMKFSNFIESLGWDDDLRDDNIGYLNNCPVLIDYSGFLE